MEFLLGSVAGLFFVITNIAGRAVLKHAKDYWSYSFYFSLIGSIVILPFIFVDLKIPTTIVPWLILIFVCGIITLHNFFSFGAQSYISPSIQGSLNKFRLLWIFLLSLIFLSAEFTWFKMLGVIFTFLAGIVLSGVIKKPDSIKGALYTIISTIIYAFIIILYDVLLQDFSVFFLTFTVFFIPALMNFLIMKSPVRRLKEYIFKDLKMLIIGAVTGGIANIFMNFSISITEDPTVAIVIIEASLIILLAGEIIILRENKNFWMKSLSVIFAVLGAVFIRVAS
jgi:drug/metabolite transporter (DMT)-like permease